jgi:hypothetical protein
VYVPPCSLGKQADDVVGGFGFFDVGAQQTATKARRRTHQVGMYPRILCLACADAYRQSTANVGILGLMS